MRIVGALVLITVLGLQTEKAPGPRVQSGIDVLARDAFAPLRGKRVGLVTNPTGVTSDLRATVDVLAKAPGVKLVALFGPEHGVRGDAKAGEIVASAKDPATGLPVYSLYGKTRKPTAEMLKGLDVLVFDIQDIGSRSYTYIATMGNCMEACAEHHVPFVVLDRPNPIGGNRVEGNILDMKFKSGVGPFPIPYCHGLTVGELAGMVNGRGWLPGGVKCDLRVVQMRDYRRRMLWPETGLPWVPTSPHIPKQETSLYYAATGIVGELPTVSIGVGYTLPFELAGAPGIDPREFAAELNRRVGPPLVPSNQWRSRELSPNSGGGRLIGFYFRPMTWRPFYAVFQGESVGGVQIYVTDPARAELTRLNFEIMDAIRKLSPGRPLFKEGTEDRMFDLVCGTDEVRKQFLAGRSSASIWSGWNAGAAPFREARKPYLLYE